MTRVIASTAPTFQRYIGIDYSGARTSTSSLPGLRAYVGAMDASPVELLPSGRHRYLSRRGMAEWLALQLQDERPTIVGIDHSFSFPLRYFEAHDLRQSWSEFLDDFQRHWPTDIEGVSVESIRQGKHGNGAARAGDSRWRRLCEQRARAKSVFHFDVPGSVAKSTHAGIPWLRHLRCRLESRVHFWPFDGWSVPAGSSVIAEAYPRLCTNQYPRADRTPDQHDAYAVACWLRDADRDGRLVKALEPDLPPSKRALAQIEGWILGVAAQ